MLSKNLLPFSSTNQANQAIDKNRLTGYIKNPTRPSYLYVISQDSMTPSERTMISTLQGLIANYSDSQIYTLNSNQQDYQVWLYDLIDNYGIDYEIVTDPWTLLYIYRFYIHGYILYDNTSKNDPSINNACTLASIKRCIAIDKSIEYKVNLLGITKMLGDCRNTDKYWAYNRLWNSGLNHSIVIELSPDKDIALRDYAIMTKSLIFYEDNIDDLTLRDKVFGSMVRDSICLGWGPDEYINISIASRHGVSVIPADWSYNLTVLSAFPSIPVSQKSFVDPPVENNVHYITFIMSDGDNQQWYLGNNFTSTKWYGSPYRGSFNMGWTISPSIYYLAPTVFNLYYKSAKHGKYNDYFLVSPSGRGYMYPSKFKKSSLHVNIERLNNYMREVDQNYLAVIDDWSLYDIDLWDKYTSQPIIQGIFYLNYNRQNDYNGQIVWSNQKPIVSCRDILWAGLEDESRLVENIYNRISSGQIKANEPYAYTFVYVHAWSKDMDSIKNVISRLKQNSRVRIVTPESFMLLIKRNLKYKYTSKQ